MCGPSAGTPLGRREFRSWPLIIIRGAGDIASGIALRLHRSGYSIIMTDLPAPTSIRRTVCFSEALRLGLCTVEDVTAVRADGTENALSLAERGQIAVLADPEGRCIHQLRPAAVVDAILAKRNLGTAITDAPVVIGIGPGFTVGVDCHAAVETMRGHTLGRTLYSGSPLPNTGIPARSAAKAPSGYSGHRRQVSLHPAWKLTVGPGQRHRRQRKRCSHGLHHRWLPPGIAAGGTGGIPRHEMRRCGPPGTGRQLHHRLG